MAVPTVVVQVISNSFFPYPLSEEKLHISESICENLINRIIAKHPSSFIDIDFDILKIQLYTEKNKGTKTFKFLPPPFVSFTQLKYG